MKLEIQDVLTRVERCEDSRAEQVKRMKDWQKMYELDAGFTQDWKDAVTNDGREQVVSSDPYNIVGLAMRLIPSQPKIDVPPRDETNQGNLDAQQLERWLTAMYGRVNWQQGSNFVDAVKLNVFKQGLGYVQALWVKDEYPEELRKKRFPILIRSLDPKAVGFVRGPKYVEYAFVKTTRSKLSVRQEYPKLTRWEKPKVKRADKVKTEADEIEVVDFWYTDEMSGKVWNCVVIDDEFAKEPKETVYPFIPIIEIKGEGDGYSILHSINGSWQYKCRLLSNIGTGVLWATWPFFAIVNDSGYEIPDITVRPMATVNVPAGTSFNQVHPDVNLSVLNTMLTHIETQISQATFPAVLYGDAGNMQAGYGVNILSQAAGGRVAQATENLETGLMWLNELVLALVEAFDDDDEGVVLWGRDAGTEKLYKLMLKKNQIKGYYENAVQLKLKLPTDDMARQTFGLRLRDGDNPLLSDQTVRDKYLGITVPADEQDRIDAERAMKHPEVMKKTAVLQFMKQYPETWEAVLAGTPLIDTAYAMVESTLPPERWSDGMMKWKTKTLGPGTMAPPGGPGPGMPPGGPGPGIQPPAMMSGPMGGGVPPAMQGQMSPENLGMMHHENPALVASAMGQPLPPNQELQALIGGQQ